jgi:hypothetical protein
MPDEVKLQTPRPPKAEPPDAGHIPMTEEMDSAKWSLPPIVPVLIALGIVAILVAIYAVHGTKFVDRPSGKLVGTTVAEQKSESPAESRVLVAVQVSVTNPGPKPVYVQGASAEVKTDAPDALKDDAAATSDFERYATAFPELKQAASTPLKLETKIMPGETLNGTVMFGFPLSKDAFDKKKSMKVWVKLYDYDPIEMKQ